MAHYALINKNNTVVQVITGVDENIIQTDLDGSQVGGTSQAWEQFYAAQPQFAGLTCKRTSYNKNIRGNFAGVGFKYDPDFDVFIAPQPYPSWTLDSDNNWQPPTPQPPPPPQTYWDEELQRWVVL